MSMDNEALYELAAEVTPAAVGIRRQIHRYPELAYEEFRTTSLLAETLRAAGIEPRVRIGKTGLTADVGNEGTLVGFRADLDALPIGERTGLPFASEVPDVMHACGHDAHAAIGVGIALALQKVSALPGRVRFVFQPAEETFPGGAHDMVREGVMDGVRAIIGFHVDPGLEPGKVGLKPGPITSSSDRLFVTLEGPGGHTARPHETVDVIYAGAKVVTDLPALLDRTLDARAPLSLVFGRFHAGSADNVIPATVELSGTCRVMDRELWDQVPGIVERLVQDIVAPTAAKATIHYQRGIPPVVNDAAVVAEVEFAVAEALGTQAVAGTHTSMGAEDFARFLDRAPGALLRLGAALRGRQVDLHSSAFDIDESAIETGILIGVASLLRLMACDW